MHNLFLLHLVYRVITQVRILIRLFVTPQVPFLCRLLRWRKGEVCEDTSRSGEGTPSPGWRLRPPAPPAEQLRLEWITQQTEHSAFHEEGVQHIMENNVLQVGSRVRVTSYTPFRGLRGTIQTVDAIPPLEGEELFCFYRIALEGTHIEEPIWFEHDEVEIIGAQEAYSLKSA